MATETWKKLAATLIPSSQTAAYTVPALTQAVIKHIRITNNTGSAVVITTWVGGTTDAYIDLPGVSLGAGESAEFDGSLVMAAGEVYYVQADTNNVCGIRIDGLEIS